VITGPDRPGYDRSLDDHVLRVPREPRTRSRHDVLRQSPGERRDALESFKTAIPDVRLSDIGMPDMDGYELIGTVRRLPPDGGGTVPALAMTAFARSEDRARALRSGFQAHLAKPCDPSELVATVASVVRRRG